MSEVVQPVAKLKVPSQSQTTWLRHVKHSGHVKVTGIGSQVHQQCVKAGWLRNLGLGTNSWALSDLGLEALP